MDDAKIRQLLEAAQYAQRQGLCRHRSGNFSIINQERTEMAITPSGLDRTELTVADIPVLNLQGKVIQNDNDRKPSSEWMMHLAAYETRPDFYAIAHTHSPFTTAFAIKGMKVLPVVFEAYFYGWKTAVTDHCCLPGTKELADSIRKPIQEVDAVLLRGHGALIGAETPMNAVEQAAYLEEVAEIYHHCLQISGTEPVPVISEADFLAYQAQNSR